jgi:hypothetical protein
MECSGLGLAVTRITINSWANKGLQPDPPDACGVRWFAALLTLSGVQCSALRRPAGG